MTAKIRLMLADDHRVVREGLRSLILQEPDMEVIGAAEDGLQAVELAGRLKPDIILMDISMPNLNGISAIRQIFRTGLQVKIITLSMHSDRRYVMESFTAGASGYLLKDCAFEEVVTAIRAVHAGESYISPLLRGTGVFDHVLSSPASLAADSPLSPRENEILQLIGEGNTTKQIARSLSISAKTVETHRMHIMEKLHINSIPALMKYALKEGIADIDK